MQIALNKAYSWGVLKGLQFNPIKTVAVIFSHKRDPIKIFPKLTLGGRELEYSKEVKYLGIILDSKLSFKQHIIEKCKKATRLMFAAKNAIGKIWGPSLENMKWMYESMVRPIITYGAIVWAHRAKTYLKYCDIILCSPLI